MPQTPQKVALVTGAARGIGLATAKRFLAEGWRVALLDIEGELLRGAVAGLADPDNTLPLHCDVSDADAVAEAMANVSRRFGRLDALVNNAGVAVFAPLLETSDADWNRVLAVNLTGPFVCTKAAAPLMREHGGGAIVNITSISAVRASTLRSACRRCAASEGTGDSCPTPCSSSRGDDLRGSRRRERERLTTLPVAPALINSEASRRRRSPRMRMAVIKLVLVMAAFSAAIAPL